MPQVDRPGVYTAELEIKHDTPYALNDVPVTLTVTAAPTWGVLEGTVTGLGYCDADPRPLEGAEITIEAAGGMTWTLSTDAGGAYGRWLDETYSPLTVTVTYPGHESGLATNVPIIGGVTTTLDFVLRLLEPCVSAEPISYEKIVFQNDVLTDSLALTNNGAVSSTFELVEWSAGGGDLPWLAEDPLTGTLDADSGQVIDLVFDTTTAGWYSGELRISNDDPFNNPIVIPVDMVVVSGTPGVALAPPSSTLAGLPGTTVTHTFTVTNTGDVTDIYDLAVTGNLWTTVAPADTSFVAPGATFSLNVVVTIPHVSITREAIIGTDAFTVTATSRLDGSSAAAAGTTNALAPYEIYLPLVVR